MLYLTVILAVSALVILFNSLPELSAGLLLSNATAVALGVAAVIIIDGTEALIIRRLLPSKIFSPDKKLFRVCRAEHNFYNKLGIKHWKDKVPELGIFTGFDKGNIKSTSDREYLSRFLLEANFGVVIHIVNAGTGFLIAALPLCSSPYIWLPIFITNLVLSLLPVFILRYNTHILYRLYLRSKRATTERSPE